MRERYGDMIDRMVKKSMGSALGMSSNIGGGSSGKFSQSSFSTSSSSGYSSSSSSTCSSPKWSGYGSDSSMP